jgi:hypothetical protein
MEKNHSRFKDLSEEEKREKILEWLEKKREEKRQCEERLRTIQHEAQLKVLYKRF